MLQTKISVEKSQALFLNEHQSLGFKDKSALVRAALDFFQKTLKNEQLRKSADLYSEIYAEDEELMDLTHSALNGWPE